MLLADNFARDRKGFTAIACTGQKLEMMNEKHIRIGLEIKFKKLK